MANDKWSSGNPWLGLAPYTEGTPLYGRTKESIQLSDIIKDNLASVVYGMSGIGKSSLLSAGISPLLRGGNYIPVRIRLLHNSDVTYLEQIENKVRETVICLDRLHDEIKDLGLWDFFHRHTFTTKEGNNCTPVIIIDQFEEIYTLTDAEHKKEIVAFFDELSDLLNDVKPDNVLEEERKYAIVHTDSSITTVPKRGIIKHTSASSFNYISAATFRFVICLREDKLYLLERNSANIPSRKANRYNLQALSLESALEVVMCPRPDLFSNKQAVAIIEKLADMGDEGIRTVDPAILSLFLYKFYEKIGQANYDNIFADYYQETTKDSKIRNKTVAFLEDHLLTLGGYRNQIPLDDAFANGVTKEEIKLLLDKALLRTEKRRGIDHIEFSHDRLCAEAKINRDKRAVLIQKKAFQKILIVSSIVLLFIAILFYALLQAIERSKEQQNHVRELEKKNLILEKTSNELEKARESLDIQLSLSEAANDSLSAMNQKYAIAIDNIRRKDKTIVGLKKSNTSNRQTIALQSDRIMSLEQEMSFIPEDVKLKARARRDSIANQNQQLKDDQLAKQNQIYNEQKKTKLNDIFGF